MKKLISLLAIFFTGFQSSYVQAETVSETTVATNISMYNQMAEQYNTVWKEKTAFKRRVLLNLRNYVNKMMNADERAELKRRWLILRIIPKNWTLPLLSTGSIVKQSSSQPTSSQIVKSGNLTIKESSFQKISEWNDFKIYESEVSAIDSNTTLERIDFLQFGSGEGINIGELYKLDHGNTIFKLTTSKDERVYKYYKRDGNPGISFDLFTGLTPGVKIWKWETVKFTVRIDTNALSNFTSWKDFQRTNIFFAKYKTKENTELASWITPQIMVYSICDEWVTVKESSTPIVFDTNLSRNLFKKTQITLYTKNIRADWRIPTESEVKAWKNTLVDQEYSSDYEAYQSDISEGFASWATYDQWLKQKYLDRLVSAYESGAITWAFYGYKSTITNQFTPPKWVSCSQLENLAKTQKVAFKSKYDELKKSETQKNYTDTINALNQKIADLQTQVKDLQLSTQTTSQSTYYPDYSIELQRAEEKARTYHNCLNGTWSNACASYGF